MQATAPSPHSEQKGCVVGAGSGRIGLARPGLSPLCSHCPGAAPAQPGPWRGRHTPLLEAGG